MASDPQVGEIADGPNGQTAKWDGNNWVIQTPTVTQDVENTALPALKRGVIGVAGAPAELGSLAVKGLGKVGQTFNYPGLTDFANKLLPNVQAPFGVPATPEGISQSVENYDKAQGQPSELSYQAQTRPGKFLQTGLEFAPATALAAMGSPESLARTAIRGLGSAGLSEAGGEAAQALDMPRVEPWARMAGALGGWGLPGVSRSSNVLPTRTEDLASQGLNTLSNQGQQMAARSTMNIDPQFYNGLSNIMADYSRSVLPDHRNPYVGDIANQLAKINQGGKIAGTDWWALRQNLANFSGDPQSQRAVGAIKGLLDSAMERSSPGWVDWNNKWAAASAAKDTAQAGVGGELEPGAFRRNIMRQQAPAYNIARAAENVTQPIQPSSTSPLGEIGGAAAGYGIANMTGHDPYTGGILGGMMGPTGLKAAANAGSGIVRSAPVQAGLRAFWPTTDPARAADAQIVRQANIPVSAAQQKGSPFLTRIEGHTPPGQQQAITDALLKQADIVRRKMPNSQVLIDPRSMALALGGGPPGNEYLPEGFGQRQPAQQ